MITIDNTKTYIVKNREYAEFYIREGGENVSVTIRSTFGNFGYFWSHCGENWKTFLKKVDMDYAMNKLSDSSIYAFDIEESVKFVKNDIIELRKTGSLTKEQAREYTDELNSLCDNDERLFMEALSEMKCYNDCYYEMSVKPIKRSIVNFWETLWIPFVESL